MSIFTRLVQIGCNWTAVALLASCATPTIDPATLTPTFAAKPPGAKTAPGQLLPSGPATEARERGTAGPIPPGAPADTTPKPSASPPTLEGQTETLTLE